MRRTVLAMPGALAPVHEGHLALMGLAKAALDPRTARDRR